MFNFAVLLFIFLSLVQVPIYLHCKESRRHSTWEYAQPMLWTAVIMGLLVYMVHSGVHWDDKKWSGVALAIAYLTASSYTTSVANQCPSYRVSEQLVAINSFSATLAFLYSLYRYMH